MAEECKSFIPSSNLGAAFIKINRQSHKVCCVSDLFFDATSGLTAEHRFIGSSLPNLYGKYSDHDLFDRVVGLDGILLLVVVVGDAHTQTANSIGCCSTTMVAKNSFDLNRLRFTRGLG